MTWITISVIASPLAVILLFMELGRQAGLWARARREGFRITSSTIEAAIFALMGLLIAFIFYGAGSRFENRRNLIVQETNAIGTAYLRVDLASPEAQPHLRELFRKYVRSRLAVYKGIPDMEAVNAALAQSQHLQESIWQQAVQATMYAGPAPQSLLLGALNEMIDITTTRTVALTTHPPLPVFVLLSFTVMVSSFLAGYGMSAVPFRDWVSIISFAVVLTTAMYVILDYEFPRIGMARIDPVDQVLADVLKRMQ